MSHYAVAVFANKIDDFENLLDPYDENAHLVPHLRDEAKLRQDYEKFLIENPSWEQLGFEYYLEQFGYRRENGQIYSYFNPKAKWDWYALDGRDYMYKLKSDAIPDNDFFVYRKNDYDYTTGEYKPYAFVTPDGVWHSPGDVWFFACDTSTEESRKKHDDEWTAYIDSQDNPYVSFVDCHI